MRLYLFVTEIECWDMHLPGKRLSPVDRQNVTEVARDGPPHSMKKENSH